jgi:hypothetical protein
VNVRVNVRDVTVNLVAQVIWVATIAGSGAALVYIFGTASIGKILRTSITTPTWVVVLAALVALAAGVMLFLVTRNSSAVRGRRDATQSNVHLMRERSRVPLNARVVRSTRFGRWAANEKLEQRSAFRQELDEAILNEGTDVRRIWNIKSPEDIARLREILMKYQGRSNHSIRAYFQLPDHVLPELLIVDGRGASMSFPSTRSPHELDWVIRFKRNDLVHVIRDYFDVLWDRAERMLDAGETTPTTDQRLKSLENLLQAPPTPD